MLDPSLAVKQNTSQAEDLSYPSLAAIQITSTATVLSDPSLSSQYNPLIQLYIYQILAQQ